MSTPVNPHTKGGGNLCNSVGTPTTTNICLLGCVFYNRIQQTQYIYIEIILHFIQYLCSINKEIDAYWFTS